MAKFMKDFGIMTNFMEEESTSSLIKRDFMKEKWRMIITKDLV